MDDDWFAGVFARGRFMAILRGLGAARSLELAERAWSSGIEVVEVPLQAPGDVEALEAVAAAARDRGLSVGAGTIVNLEGVRDAARAGASFTVSPGFDAEVVRAVQVRSMAALPGVATATELQAAWKLGLTWFKAFPATSLGSRWVKEMRGPFPSARFVATGGMNATNAQEFFDAGYDVVAVGSALADPSQMARLAEVGIATRG